MLENCAVLSALTEGRDKTTLSAGWSGGYSSMVEPQIVVLDVAGSSPVGHPILSEASYIVV